MGQIWVTGLSVSMGSLAIPLPIVVIRPVGTMVAAGRADFVPDIFNVRMGIVYPSLIAGTGPATRTRVKTVHPVQGTARVMTARSVTKTHVVDRIAALRNAGTTGVAVPAGQRADTNVMTV